MQDKERAVSMEKYIYDRENGLWYEDCVEGNSVRLVIILERLLHFIVCFLRISCYNL